MGSNQNRHGDKGRTREWGSKPRKEEARTKRHSFDDAAIADSEVDGKPVHGGKRRKKDTKRWCRGKVGKEHDYRPFNKYPSLARVWRHFGVEKCDECGKERFTRP